PNLIVGLQTSDDAAVWRLDDDHAIIQTVDFFPPIVDDPYTFGAVAAANSMSDVYAMGGEVLFALAVAGFPQDFPPDVITEVFRGGAEKVAEAGGVIAGGHTVQDAEPKYGLCVTGLIHPARVATKGGAQVGDQLILTKRLGTGLITTANKQGIAQPHHLDAAIASMSQLNRTAARIMLEVGIHAATDITGYALLGHAHEMAERSPAGLRIVADALPLLDGALDYARMGAVSGGTGRNRIHLVEKVRLPRNLSKEMNDLLHDPQTSGGLLIATPPRQADEMMKRFADAGQEAWIIGEAIEEPGLEVV
ncbi:MAG: selenide, water dikinase SelD, partial [Chloroflexota bacterium]